MSYRRTGNFFDSDGVRLHFSVDGEGLPVILLHGFAADTFINWRVPGIIRALSKQFQVVGLDIRGHGRSEKPCRPGAYGRELVEDVRRLMEHLGIGRAHLLGYSMGGFIALDFLGNYPGKVYSAAIGGAGWFPEGEYPEIVTTLPAALDVGKGYLPILRYLERGRGGTGEWRFHVASAAIGLLNNSKALARCFESLTELQGSEEQMKNNRVPVLTFIGSEDPLRPAVENMKGRAANHTVRYIQGGNHGSTLAWPPHARRVARMVRHFMVLHSPVMLPGPTLASASN